MRCGFFEVAAAPDKILLGSKKPLSGPVSPGELVASSERRLGEVLPARASRPAPAGIARAPLRTDEKALQAADALMENNL